jgi:glycosyltransferase involved in cell wall biosynthesis
MVVLFPDLVSSSTIFDIFLHTTAGANQDLAPLTAFMLHVWHQKGLPHRALHEVREREEFVYWFYDSYHLSRSPYRLAAPPNTLRWLNVKALDLSEKLARNGAPPAAPLYMTRYMLHVWEQTQREVDVFHAEGYLRFLAWFALQYIPSRNLPAALLPEDLLPLLNHAVRPPLPVTAAMAAWAELRGMAAAHDMATAAEDVVVALSFEILSDLLQAGDPRLIPDLVSQFWSKKMSPDTEALTAYEYFLVRACRPELAPDAARGWLSTRCHATIPEAELFSAVPHSAPIPFGSALNSPEKVIVVYRDHHTIAGLSKAGLHTKEALRRSGLDVIDLDFSFGRERLAEEGRHNFPRRRSSRSAIHILNLNPEYVPECLMCHLSSLDESAYRIGQFYWELSDIAPIHECGLSLVQEIWVATEYLRDVYRKRVSVPVQVMGQAIESAAPDSRFDRSRFNLPQSTYMFLFSFDAGSVVERKNPLACVRAFRQAFPAATESAALVLKTRNLEGMPTDRDRDHWRQVTEIAAGDSRIHILDATMTGAELTGLLATCDCYLSLHRSEGFGYGPADAMALGKPVITTGYSGVIDFCTDATALLVDYALERVPSGAYPYTDDSREYYWASPDIDAAAFQMRKLYADPRLGERLGKSGRQLIRERYSMAALQRRYLSRLAELGWL